MEHLVFHHSFHHLHTSQQPNSCDQIIILMSLRLQQRSIVFLCVFTWNFIRCDHANKCDSEAHMTSTLTFTFVINGFKPSQNRH